MKNAVFSVRYALIAKQYLQWQYEFVCLIKGEIFHFFSLLPVTVSCSLRTLLDIHKDQWEHSDVEKLLVNTIQLLCFYLTQNKCKFSFKWYSNILLYSEFLRETFDHFLLYKQCQQDQHPELKESKVKYGSLFIVFLF
jgi:hypothetical protein